MLIYWVDKLVCNQYYISMYLQKVYKNGTSIAVTIPKQLAHELNIRDGSEVVVDKKNGAMIVRPQNKRKQTKGQVNDKFMQMVDEFAKEHEETLRDLATR